MSYEFCVFEPAYAADRDAAHAAWNDEKYWDASLPDGDCTAKKWGVKDLLMTFDSRLRWTEPKAFKTGLFAKWFSKPAVVQRCLHMYLEDDYGETAIDLFDQAIEITLPWETPRDEAEKQVRALWRYLEYLSASGWSTIYDTERGVLLNLQTDIDAVTARYLENLGPEDDADDTKGAGAKAATAAPVTQSKRDKLFTGNVD